MARLTFTRLAELDLADILGYIAVDDPASAVRTVARLEEACGLLARNPGAGRERSELAPDLRSFPVGNHVVFYRRIDAGVLIVRVLHGARDIRNGLPPEPARGKPLTP